MKTFVLILFISILTSCGSTVERYPAQEYFVSSDETLDEIIEKEFPEYILKDPIQKNNLYMILKEYNPHIRNFPEFKGGEKIFLSRPLSPYLQGY